MQNPDWQWTDHDGDTMKVWRAGGGILVTVKRRDDPDDYEHAAVSLTPEQTRGLRAALLSIPPVCR